MMEASGIEPDSQGGKPRPGHQSHAPIRTDDGRSGSRTHKGGDTHQGPVLLRLPVSPCGQEKGFYVDGESA